MNKCKNCKATLPIRPSRRSFIERHLTKRNTIKYKCQECKVLQFLSPLLD